MNERHGTAPAFGLHWRPRGLMWKRSDMELTPREKDKLLIFTAALLAERRKARGLKLNYPEAVALISAAVMEGIAEMIPDIQVEATFPDGTKLVTVHQPIV